VEFHWGTQLPYNTIIKFTSKKIKLFMGKKMNTTIKLKNEKTIV